MKKVIAILFVAGMASLAACTSKTEGTGDSTTVDTTATSVMADTTTAPADTTAKADTTK